MLLLHVSADSCGSAAAGSQDADLHSGALSAGQSGERLQNDGLHQELVTWLDGVVKGINALPGARDSLLLVLLLSAVRWRPVLLHKVPALRPSMHGYFCSMLSGT